MPALSLRRARGRGPAGEEAIRRTRPRSARGARRGGHAGGPVAGVSPGEVEWSSGLQLLGRAGGPRYAARLPRRLRRLTGAEERGVRKVEPNEDREAHQWWQERH